MKRLAVHVPAANNFCISPFVSKMRKIKSPMATGDTRAKIGMFLTGVELVSLVRALVHTCLTLSVN